MALSDEQNAMLRLLASGEQGYEDIAALMGLSVDEVRAKVVGALAQLQAEGKPVPNVPPPLPGGAQPAAEVVPPEPEPVAEPPKGEPAAEPVIADQVAPKADTPEPKASEAAGPGTAASSAGAAAAAKPAAAASPPPSDRQPSGGRTVTLPTGRKAWLLGGGVVGAIVVIVVVILLVSGGGGSGSTTTGNEGTGTAAANEGGSKTSSKEATEATLKAVDGSEAKGRAIFGRYKKKLALAIEATGLEPTTEGTNSYTVWLAKSPTKMVPLVSTGVKGSGKGANEIAGEYEVPVEVLAYLANGTFDTIEITKTDNKEFETSYEAAKKEKTTMAYTGKAVLRGTITGPIVGLAQREKEEEEKGK